MEEKLRVTGWGSTGRGNETTSITWSGVPKDQQDHVEGVVNGQHWMTVKDGKLVFSPTREPLPDPVKDEGMLPFWRELKDEQTVMKGLMFDPEERCDSPSFMVKHLCGYHYTPENYRGEADTLTDYGFVCMRSPRGADGQFWETWYLPGTWAAKGKLGKLVERNKAKGLRHKKMIKSVVQFLCHNVSFGQLDVTVQRAAMTIDD